VKDVYELARAFYESEERGSTSLRHLRLARNKLDFYAGTLLGEAVSVSKTNPGADFKDYIRRRTAENVECLADAIVYLSKLSSFQELDLSGMHLGGDGAAALAEGLRRAGGMKHLQVLDLSSNKIHSTGMATLADTLCSEGILPSIHTLIFASNLCMGINLVAGLRSKHALPSLRVLDFRFCFTGDAGATEFAETLVASDACRSLEELNLDANAITDIGAHNLLRAMRNPTFAPSLRRICLRENRISPSVQDQFDERAAFIYEFN
jgi:Ran GTPase-activating protein (RanGAP) involved in mRNA processing and transport